MRIVVSGKVTIRPTKPSNVPHTDSDSSSMAGFKPMALPMILGVMIMSMMICTMQNTATALARMTQKFCPVSAALSKARKAVGMRAKVCR